MELSRYFAFYSIFVTICKELCELFRHRLMEIDKYLIVSSADHFGQRQVFCQLVVEDPLDHIPFD